MSHVAAAYRRLAWFPWLWSGLGALALWLGIALVAHRGVGGTLIADVQIGSFLVLVGLGQMLVVATGSGNIDLSIPNVMTLSSLVALSIVDNGQGNLWVGLAAGLGVGVVVAAANILSIFVLGVPPIVATLGVGLLAQSAVLIRATNFTQVAPPDLQQFVTESVLGIPVIALVALAASLAVAGLLHRTRFGRSVFAVGQSRAAAERSGVPITATMAGAYVLSGVLAALAGIALAAFSGASITLGDPYLLTSVGVVVLGGSLISGGRANVTGIWTAALLLNLIVTFVYVLHFSVAVQDVFEGLVIIAVLSLGASTLSSRVRQ